MKYEIKKTVHLKLDLDVHELTMLDKGGMQILEMKKLEDWEDGDCPIISIMEELERCDKFVVSIQSGACDRFKANKQQAETHRKQWDEINEGEKEQAKKRLRDRLKQASSEAEKASDEKRI